MKKMAYAILLVVGFLGMVPVAHAATRPWYSCQEETPIPATKSECDKCPNRVYMRGKCILREQVGCADSDYAEANKCECNPDCSCKGYAELNPCECTPTSCACPSYLAEKKQKCTAGGGTFNETECRCVCPIRDKADCTGPGKYYDEENCQCKTCSDPSESQTCCSTYPGAYWELGANVCCWDDNLFTNKACCEAQSGSFEDGKCYTWADTTCTSPNDSLECCVVATWGSEEYWDGSRCCPTYPVDGICCPSEKVANGHCCESAQESEACCKAFDRPWLNGACCSGYDESEACCVAAGYQWQDGLCCPSKDASEACCNALGGNDHAWNGWKCEIINCNSIDESEECCYKDGKYNEWTGSVCCTAANLFDTEECCNRLAGLEWIDGKCDGACTSRQDSQECCEIDAWNVWSNGVCCVIGGDDYHFYVTPYTENCCEAIGYTTRNGDCCDGDYSLFTGKTSQSCCDRTDKNGNKWELIDGKCVYKACKEMPDCCKETSIKIDGNEVNGQWIDGKCVYTTCELSEGTACTTKGWAYDWNTCKCEFSCSVAEETACTTKGGTYDWNTCKCKFPCSAANETACKANGGSYNYETCACLCSKTCVEGIMDNQCGTCTCNAGAEAACQEKPGKFDAETCTCTTCQKNADTICAKIGGTFDAENCKCSGCDEAHKVEKEYYRGGGCADMVTGMFCPDEDPPDCTSNTFAGWCLRGDGRLMVAWERDSYCAGKPGCISMSEEPICIDETEFEE